MSGGADKFDLSGEKCEDLRVKKTMNEFDVDEKTAIAILHYVTDEAKILMQKWLTGSHRIAAETRKAQAEEAYDLFKLLKTGWSYQRAELLEQKLLAMATEKEYEATLVPRKV
jgi:hypothetical protein